MTDPVAATKGYTENLVNFINEDEIWEHLRKTENPDKALVRDVLDKAHSVDHKGLNQFETAVLLQNTDPEMDEEIFEVARSIKQRIYGNRMVLFAPLYITNVCKNNCAYCGFSANNKELKRRTLTMDEIGEEVEVLENMGHKRVLMVYGEYDYDVDWIVDTVKAVYDTHTGKSGEIRRVNINCAPLDIDGYKKLKASGIGTYQCFQETYHRETYKKVHLGGKKRDYLYRLYALHRAQCGGLDDIATGALFGLFDHRFETLALLQHAEELERVFGVGPHTISFPRLEPAQGAEMSYNPPYPLTDHQFKKLVAILRIAVPYTGLILTTRETADLRREVLQVGASQLSAASRTYPGAYKDMIHNRPDVQQFCTGDDRSLDEVIYDMVTNLGYIPSFCTGCYRLGRTGDHFMGLAKSSFINQFCGPNALLTFSEYLNDYAGEKTRKVGRELIKNELEKIPDETRREKTRTRLNEIDGGKRDLFF